jgi:outer membrane receptor protein involved in Fe transport
MRLPTFGPRLLARMTARVAALIAALALATAAATTAATAQEAARATGTVTGVVRSAPAGAALPGVEVRIAGTAVRATTDTRGRFTLGAAPAGPATVEARRLGWAFTTVATTVPAGATVDLTIALREAPAALDQVVVTATRGERERQNVPAAVAVRNVEQLRNQGFTFGTDEFRGVPGVSFRRGEGDGDEFPFVSIRGSTGTEGYLTLVDGIPLVGIYEEGLLNQVPYDALDRIEVLKGPVSALYGRGALYGAVNYLTKSPQGSGGTVSLAAGADRYYRAQGTLERMGTSGRANGVGVLVSGALEDYGGWRANGGRRLGNLFAKLQAPLGERTTATVYANYADRRSELPNGLPVAADGAVLAVAGGREAFLGFGTPVNDQQIAIGAVRVEHRAARDLAFTVTTHARRVDQAVLLNFYDPFGFDPARTVYAVNGFRGATRQNVLYGEATARWTPRAGRTAHDVLFGVAGERSTVREDIRWSGQYGFTDECGFAFYLVEIDYTTGAVVNRDHPCFAVDRPQTRDRFVNPVWGAFAQDEIALTPSLFLTIGGRYDAFRRRATFEAVPDATAGGVLRGDADALSARAALSRRYTGGQLYASFGRGFNSNFGPTFEWDASQYLRPESRPTTIDSYEVGWKASALGERLRVEAAGFFTRQRNRRVTVPNPAAADDFSAPSNLITYGQLYDSRGVELSVRAQPAPRTGLTASYSYVDPEWKDFVITTFSGARIDLSGKTPVGVARHVAYLAADHHATSWLAGRAAYEFYDDYQITQDNAVAGGGYELLTLGATLSPARWRRVSLDVTLNNALDRTYWSYFGGRTAPTYATPGVPRQLRAILRAALR